MAAHAFGGRWTEEKLLCLRDYLPHYLQVLKNQAFETIYVDAFAGTGFRTPSTGEIAQELQEDLKGSAAIALSLDPFFDKYVFVEQDAGRFAELTQLKGTFPEHAGRITFVQDEGNQAIRRFCKETWWATNRAIVFLDPYGMQVEWETLRHIAKTGAIDLWLLFPVGVAVNRLLTQDGKMDEGWSRALDKMFGDHGWYEAFYEPDPQLSLFGGDQNFTKNTNPKGISRYFSSRLATIFPAVVKEPLFLYNSINSPLYSLHFASANKGRGGEIATKIAGHILRKR